MSSTIAKVEPLTTARALRGPFDYLLPARLGVVEVGTVLEVPFGHRRILGVVVELAEHSALAPERLAEPIAALAAGAPAELVRLGLWVAEQYCSTPARGLELVLPPGTSTARGQTAARVEATVVATEAAQNALDDEGRLGAVQRRALTLLIAAGPGVELGSSELKARGIERDVLRRLERRGLVRLGQRSVQRRPATATVGAVAGTVDLNQAQRAAVTRIIAGLDGEGCELLLHGVTGSGKTEVYLAAAGAALERGMGAIVLVPEIAMTPQALSRFDARFGDQVAVLHSRLSAGERRDEWHRLRSGEARICVGPRSAIFAPVSALGLIVVDEEHDSSYKQEGDPRYDAREVARRRVQECGGNGGGRGAIVFGSATPRPESWQALERIELPERVDGRALPAVEIVDMRDRDGREGPLHPTTQDALAELRSGDGKAIVLINRRGWSPHLSCRHCGRVWQCEACDVSLVLHRVSGLHCHHCGHAEPAPESCPDCGSVSLARAGAGSERIEDVISAAVAPLPVFRLDSDAAAGSGGHLEILRRFEAAETGVLVGTQMVAKGHDFPDVVLAIVLDADSTLRFPDLRAEERTFALVSQLAGRSGRGAGAGRVLVQTLAPGATSIRHAAAHDAAGFVRGELERRRELGYPPFAHLIRVELVAADVARLDRVATELRSELDQALPEGATALGPAPRFRLRGRERRQILVKAPDRAPAVSAVRGIVEAAASARKLEQIAIAVDVDPQ